MRRLVLALVLFCAPQAALAQASAADEARLRDLAEGFRADPTEARVTEVAALLTRARAGSASGTMPMGFFPGTLSPLAAPVPLNAAGQVEAHCATTYLSSLPNAALPDGDDRIRLHRRADGWVDIDFDMRDAEGRLQLALSANGDQHVLTRLQAEDASGRLDVAPVPGGLRDNDTGAVIGEGDQDYIGIMAMVEAIVANNPGWFIDRAQVRLGQAWIGSDSPDDALQSAAAVLGALTGGASTLGQFSYAGGAVGLTQDGGRPGIVFEFIALVPLTLPGRAPVSMALSGYEIYDIATLYRATSVYTVDMQIDRQEISILQRQECSLD